MKELFMLLRELHACTAAAERAGVPRQDLPDIAQKGRIAAWRACIQEKDVGTPDKARAYLRGVGQRLAANYHRQRRRVPEPRDPAEIAKTAVEDGEAALLGHARVARLDLALAQLAAERPELHAVVVEHGLDGRPIADLAREHRVPLNTAWNRLRLGRLELRRALGEGRR